MSRRLRNKGEDALILFMAFVCIVFTCAFIGLGGRVFGLIPW